MMSARATSGLLFAIILLALILRVPLLDESAYYDEMWTLSAMKADTLDVFWREHRHSDPPAALAPVYFLSLYGWLKVTGFGVAQARFYSLVCGLLTIPLVYLVGRRLHSRPAGLLAAAFTALALMHIHYSVEIRMYALTMLFALGSVWSLLRLMEAPALARWLPHVAVNALLVWTHLFAAALLLVEMLFVLAAHRWNATTRRWFLAHAALALVLAVWIASQWSPEADTVASWFDRPAWRDLANAFVVYAGGRYTNWDPSPRLPWALSLDVALLAVLAGLSVMAVRRLPPSTAMLLAGWAILPALLIFAESLLLRPVFVYRYALYSSFALWLLAAIGLTTLPRPAWRWIAGGVVACLFCYQLLTLRMPLRPDYRSAALAVPAHATIIALKDYNARALIFNGDIPAERVRSIDQEEALFDATHESTEDGGEAHVIFWRWMRLDAFEHFLRENQIQFHRTDHGGLPPMYRYVIQRDP